MNQQGRRNPFNMDTAAGLVWLTFFCVVCYTISVWLAIAVIERDNALAAFSDDVYWFAAALTAIITCAAGFAVVRRRDRDARREQRGADGVGTYGRA